MTTQTDKIVNVTQKQMTVIEDAVAGTAASKVKEGAYDGRSLRHLISRGVLTKDLSLRASMKDAKFNVRA